MSVTYQKRGIAIISILVGLSLGGFLVVWGFFGYLQPREPSQLIIDVPRYTITRTATTYTLAYTTITVEATTYTNTGGQDIVTIPNPGYDSLALTGVGIIIMILGVLPYLIVRPKRSTLQPSYASIAPTTPSAVRLERPRFCRKCGTPTRADSDFCERCGLDLRGNG